MAGVHSGREKGHRAVSSQFHEDPQESQGLTLRDYLGVLWRRKWVVLLVVVVATGAAYGFAATKTKQYEASAQLIYGTNVDVANPLSATAPDPTSRTVEMQSVGNVLA